ncbi:MAG: HAMP domain-containing protein [Deltaproteobacteria bacterium]|nr:HAMP domain-containing protein [Deltaproteobacteria bacterium]
MRLRTKLFLVTAVATVAPIVGATLVGRVLVIRASHADFKHQLEDGEREARTQFSAFVGEVDEAVRRLADAEDRFVGPLLLARAKGGPDDELVRRLPTEAPRVMRERGLDVLDVLDAKGRILASGHFPGRLGDVASHGPPPRGPRTGVLRKVRALVDGQPVTRLALVSGRRARSPLGGHVWVEGGRFLDERFVRRLRFRGQTHVLIRDVQGGMVVEPAKGWGRFSRFPHHRVVLGTKASGSATLVLAVSDAQLRLTLEIINYVAIALGAGALLLALLVGALARPITRPLEELVVAAELVAAGDLGQQIPVRSRDEVGELVASFNRMTSELQDSKDRLVAAERVAAWREIARRIAHEIKNPLFPIQTSIETLRKVYDKQHPAFPEIFEESTSTILEEVDRLKHIVSEFSRFARIPKPVLCPFDVSEWLDVNLGLYAEGMQIQRDVEPEIQINGDRDQLTQVLVNLVKNAREASAGAAEPTLRAVARRDGEVLVLEIGDNGAGFDEETARQLFTPYFTTKGSAGTGLGLAICQRIVTEHGGSIEARAEVGQGATFALRLPLAGPPVPA